MGHARSRRSTAIRRLSWLPAFLLVALAGLALAGYSASPATGAPPRATGGSVPAPPSGLPGAGAARAAPCTVEEWRADLPGCVDRLVDVAGQRVQCLKAPTPEAPDSGLAGWFASQPESAERSGVGGRYSDYGYAGYSYTTYDIGCAPTLMHPDFRFENTVANGEFLLATAVIGASNALRERAWDPGLMWGWADPLVEQATRSIYTRVFTVFGTVTLAVVGLYLLWRSRQAEMSAAMTTAGWALLVMVAVTALAAWPVVSAHLADKALVTSLGVVHDAVGPPAKDIPPSECRLPDPQACRDQRPPAVRASDTAVEAMLYRNWLRGLLGSADSLTAQKYGPVLYDARSLSWGELQTIRTDPQTRDVIFERKSAQWMKVAEQIRSEDPEAYEYLTGVKGMERIGAGVIALLAAVLFALFDLTAALLVLLGFLVFRWAVISAPILGTVGLLRPASAGFRRLVNAVVAALFNIVIFGTGAAIYLFAVDLIMSTPTLPGWLQVVLVFLCGVVGWLLLRPYRRITQLGGRDPAAAAATGWRRRVPDTPTPAVPAVTRTGGAERTAGRRPARVELGSETPVRATGAGHGGAGIGRDGEVRADEVRAHDGQAGFGPEPAAVPRLVDPGGAGWTEPDGDVVSRYTLYRPGRRTGGATPASPRSTASIRVEGRPDVH